jgi:hypothetical protein
MMRTASKQKFPPKMKMTTDIPPEITTPGTVETRLGTLKFFDGLPDKATVEKVYDNLDFMRGLEVFLNTMAAASTLANVEGLKSVGGNNQTRRAARESRGRQDTPADAKHPDRDSLELHQSEGRPHRRLDTPGRARDGGRSVDALHRGLGLGGARTRARAASISSCPRAIREKFQTVTSWHTRVRLACG